MNEYRDRWRDRFQVELGVSWRLTPGKDMTWREWLFDPACGLTKIGQDLPLGKGRTFLPDGLDIRAAVTEIDDGRCPETNMRLWHYRSRVFWARAACRLLGLDIGGGVYYRQRYVKDLP